MAKSKKLGRPSLTATVTDPKVPIDVRYSTRARVSNLGLALGEQKTRLGGKPGKLTQDETIVFLLDYYYSKRNS